MDKDTKTLTVALIIAGFSFPFFQSGLRRDINFFEWVWNHTIFGPRPLYVPKELATKELAMEELLSHETPIPF